MDTLTFLRSDAEKNLLERIDLLKVNLIETGLLYGINDPLTISVSQDLDILITEYQRLAIK